MIKNTPSRLTDESNSPKKIYAKIIDEIGIPPVSIDTLLDTCQLATALKQNHPPTVVIVASMKQTIKTCIDTIFNPLMIYATRNDTKLIKPRNIMKA